MAGYTDEQVVLASAVADLRKISETTTDLFSIVDFADATTFANEDGTATRGMRFDYSTAFAMALQRPSATATAYITDQHLRQIRAASRAFATLNPYWMSVRENRISYTIGSGHVLSVVPKHPDKEAPESLLRDAKDELDKFQRANRYRRVQGEKLTRLDRDGEFFLRMEEEDGTLLVEFVEPILIQNPPGKSEEDDCWFGVQFQNQRYSRPVGYYIRVSDYNGRVTGDMIQQWETMIPVADMQHRTANVDISSPRGLPSTYCLQEPATQALSTLKSMGRLVDIRARIALIRKQVNATLGQIQPLLQRNRVGQTQGAAGTLRNVFGFPYGSVMDTNDQRTFEFPSQHIETDKIVHSLKSDLQAVAAAMGLADFAISGDSTQSFANALVKEGPMDRAISRLQQDLIDDDVEVYERALTVAAKNGRLDKDVLEKIAIEILPPAVIARNRIQDTQADEILVRNGAMSPDTMSMKDGLNPASERRKAKANPSPQLMQTGTGDTRSHQAPTSGKTTARGIPGGAEPGPGANIQKAAEGED